MALPYSYTCKAYGFCLFQNSGRLAHCQADHPQGEKKTNKDKRYFLNFIFVFHSQTPLFGMNAEPVPDENVKSSTS